MTELKYLDITKTNKGHIKVPSVEGMYPDMGAGRAEAIVTNIHDTDLTPYVFRKTPFRSTRETEKMIGVSVPWNQLVEHGNFDASTGWNGAYTIGGGTASRTYTSSGNFNSTISRSMPSTEGHKYLVSAKYKCTAANRIRVRYPFVSGEKATTANTWGEFFWVGSAGSGQSYIGTQVDSISGESDTYEYIYCTDLTLALGSSIADYIYTLESGTAGAGVAKLREWGFFDKPYYAYNAGAIESVNVSKHRMVGLNQWDEEWEAGGYDANGAKSTNNNALRSKNYIPAFPSTVYYVTNGQGTGRNAYVNFYDLSKKFISRAYVAGNGTFTTPANCQYITFFALASGGIGDYAHDICIAFSSPLNGTYAPYEVHEYPLADITLRGILKLDGSNNLYADGDVYESSGSVTRKYAERAYQAGDESLADAITDGTTTVYKLTTPTTETTDPFTNPQVCSPYGTEEYVDRAVAAGTRDVSILCGHETEYAKDIVGSIEGIPFPPSSNGTYSLKVTVASGVPTYSWVNG